MALRDHLLAPDAAGPDEGPPGAGRAEGELDQLLRDYADSLVSDDRDRRLLDEFAAQSTEWTSAATEVMALADAGRREESAALLASPRVAGVGAHASEAFREWIAHNQDLAKSAGAATLVSLGDARRNTGIAVALALLLSGGLGLLTFRRIVGPVRALKTSVESIVGGDFGAAVPHTHAVDETGALARSIDVLRRGAAAIGGPALGQVPRGDTHWQPARVGDPRRVRRAAALGPGAGAGWGGSGLPRSGGRRDAAAADRPLRPGGVELRPRSGRDSATGSSASARAKASRSTSRVCPPTTCASLRVWAGPRRRRRWPGRSRRATRSSRCSSSPRFRALGAREQALVEELLPGAALSLEVLQRNLGTQELLLQTRDQAEELEAQQKSLRRAQDELQVTEQFFRNVLELAPDGLMVADEQGVIQLANAKCEELFGYPPARSSSASRSRCWCRTTCARRHPGLREAFHRGGLSAFDGRRPRAARPAQGWLRCSRWRSGSAHFPRRQGEGRASRRVHP